MHDLFLFFTVKCFVFLIIIHWNYQFYYNTIYLTIFFLNSKKKETKFDSFKTKSEYHFAHGANFNSSPIIKVINYIELREFNPIYKMYVWKFINLIFFIILIKYFVIVLSMSFFYFIYVLWTEQNEIWRT